MPNPRKPPEPVPFDKPLVKARVPELSLILDDGIARNGGISSSTDVVATAVSKQYCAPHQPAGSTVEHRGYLQTAGVMAGSDMGPLGGCGIQSSSDMNSYHAWRMRNKLYLPSEKVEENKEFAAVGTACSPVHGVGNDGNKTQQDYVNRNSNECANAAVQMESKVGNTAQANAQGNPDSSIYVEFDSDDYENYAAETAKNYMHFLEASLRGKYDEPKEPTGNSRNQNVLRSTPEPNSSMTRHKNQQPPVKQNFGCAYSESVAGSTPNAECFTKGPVTVSDKVKEPFLPYQVQISQTAPQHAPVEHGDLVTHVKRGYVSHDSHLEPSRSVPLQQNNFGNPFNQQQMYQKTHGKNTNLNDNCPDFHCRPHSPYNSKLQAVRENKPSKQMSPKGIHNLENVITVHHHPGHRSPLAIDSYPHTTDRPGEFNSHEHQERIVPLQQRTHGLCGGGHNPRTVGDDSPKNHGGTTMVTHEVLQGTVARNVELLNGKVGFSSKNAVGEHFELENKTVFPPGNFSLCRNDESSGQTTKHVKCPDWQLGARSPPTDSCRTMPRMCEHTGQMQPGGKEHGMNANLTGTCSVQGCIDDHEFQNSCAARKCTHHIERVGEPRGCKEVQPFPAASERQEEFRNCVAQGCSRCAPHQTHKHGCAGACTAPSLENRDQSSSVDRAMLLSMMEMIKWQSRQLQALQDRLSELASQQHRDRKQASRSTQTYPGQFTVSIGIGTTTTREQVRPAGSQRGVVKKHSRKQCEHCLPPRPPPSTDESLTLRDLQVLDVPEPAVSPVGSVHVVMRDSSQSSDDESASAHAENIEDQHLNAQNLQENCVGWTFYNNIVGQVNKLLEAPCAAEAGTACPGGSGDAAAPESVRQATLEQLRKLGLSMCDQEEAGKRVTFDSVFCPRVDRMAVNNSDESESSLLINALALKYLKDDQLTEFARLSAGGMKKPERLQDVTVYGMATHTTNLSFATMRYLERYHLLPGSTNVHGGNAAPGMNANMEPKPVAACQQTRSPAKFPSKLLDITTLRQQPKFL